MILFAEVRCRRGVLGGHDYPITHIFVKAETPFGPIYGELTDLEARLMATDFLYSLFAQMAQFSNERFFERAAS